MICRIFGRLAWQPVFASVVVLGFALPAAAQGRISGNVVDGKGQPVADAKVVLEEMYGGSHKFETKTDKKGEFTQVGVVDPDPLGGKSESIFKVTAATKDGTATTSARVTIGTSAVVHLVITASAPVASASGGGTSKADAAAAAKGAEGRKAFEAGVELNRAGKYDESIDQFNKALAVTPMCPECYFDIGYARAQKKDYEKAEENYKKAIELKADYAEAYMGLSSIYNAQRKFDLAAAASAKASELATAASGAQGGNADLLYNEGVILWNSGKIPDAKAKFQAAIAVNANHAESHYQLAMALVNEGKLADAGTEFNAYLKLSPNGQNAATAKALVAQLPK